ncbi:MAG: tyrosine--tRNA ligase, partial [Aquificaceae bacterium]|nr:tyrosine--tRNA ligase [Aquificaceae bacterium]
MSFEKLVKNASEIISQEELGQKLKKNKPLRIKIGFDPTAPDLHLGHLVLLKKLRQFQEEGHEVFLIVGDFTALIGDPTGRSSVRPRLSKSEVEENAKTYQEQAFKVLIKEKTKVLFNSEWLSALGTDGAIRLLSKWTLARMLERDDFSARFKSQNPIFLHELFYPLLQGYDSVKVQADVELGGTDQKFNLLVGRELQREQGQEPQVCMLMPLLVGLDGQRKMSKSYGNYVGITDSPRDMFGKVMSIPDSLMPDYFRLLTDLKPKEFESLIKEHPMKAKKRLAFEITSFLHSESEALDALRHFEEVFSHRQFPEDATQVEVKAGKYRLIDLLSILDSTASRNAIWRLITGGGAKINGEKLLDPNLELEVSQELKIQLGKRAFYVV